jgi:uncharacterized protein YbjT (DUF2867 family)
MGLTLWLAGSTGLVGSHLETLLCREPGVECLYSLRRNTADQDRAPLFIRAVDFGAPEPYTALPPPDAVLCCLGTTMKRAGSQEAFRRVDYGMVLQLAEAARLAGCPSFHLLTSMGANPNSPVFYNRIKGEAERDVLRLGFRATCIYRPSLLLGSRSENRTGEKLAQQLMPHMAFLLQGPLRKYRAIEAEDVARAMLAMVLREPLEGTYTMSSDELQQLADRLRNRQKGTS